jgi:adenylate cyclase
MQQYEPLAAIAMDENAFEIIGWLASDECHELDQAGLIDGLGAKLCKAGMPPLHRMVFHLRTLHPTVVGRAIT